MRIGRVVLAVAGAALIALSACGRNDRTPNLMHLRSATDGPDEFAILPPKALAMPADVTTLPDPTPGGANLTDHHPQNDAIIALGGKPSAATSIPTADAGLVNYADRNGVTAGIRDTLATDDLAFRRAHPGKLLERVFSVNSYFGAYHASWLDAYKELARWRAAGVQTPSAPPAAPAK